uniref:THAP-type domain-containing protein n=1 Tax=Hippocampus comes TaxID=109280 RepID=A0A3Q2XT82_HIPCM
MVRICCVLGCTNKSLSKTRRSAWVAAVRRKDITFANITPFIFVCCRHFHRGKIVGISSRFESTMKEPTLCEEEVTWKLEETSYVIVKRELTESNADGCGIGTKEVKQEETNGQAECKLCIQRVAEISRLVEENRRLRRELDAFKMPDGFFEDDDNKVEYYTGMPNVGSFMTFFCFLLPLMPARESRLSPFQVLLLTFMRLRLDLPSQHLAHIFSVSTSTVDTMFQDTVSFLYTNLRTSITWPSRSTLQRTIPRQFVEAFGRKAVAIVDCFRVFVQKPARHKEHGSNDAVRYLIAVTPCGFVGFVSKGRDGFMATKKILQESGFLNKLLPGDVVLGNGFDADKSGVSFYAEVDEPTFVRADGCLAEKEVGGVTHLGAHIETMLGKMHRKYQIFKVALPVDAMRLLDGEEVTLLDKMVAVCCALENRCLSAF